MIPDPDESVHGAKSSKRFRIAISFAGEKRDFVERVARILAERFGEAAILYDKFHEAEFCRYDLGIYLPKLYREQADLVVAVFSLDYDKRRWTGWEWVAIHAQLTKEDGSKVMLSRFNYANPDGLFENAAFAELDGKTEAQAATLILERLALNEGHQKDYYTRPATLPQLPRDTEIPHNLPSLQPFFGRENELKKIADALDPESRTWGAIIDGPGGMGKTSLAVRAAYNASPEDFKRIVFVSLKTRELDDDGVRDLSGFILSGIVELFNELSRELGHDDIAEVSETQRPRMLLESLRNTQTLLILDNLESLVRSERDTLFTFVKRLPAGCKAILTSRGRIGSGGEELILRELSQEAALATLAELAERNDLLSKTSQAERLALYQETSGKPLLLRWTAGQLGRGNCITFADALCFLRSCPKGNDPLDFIFGDLVEDFSEAETKSLCALTYFTLPARVEHIFNLVNPFFEEEENLDEWEVECSTNSLESDFRGNQEHAQQGSLSILEVEAALRSLVNRSLVVPNADLTTFALVPMVSDFLRKRKPDVVLEAGGRLENAAYALVMENGQTYHERFSILDTAWPTVAAALPRFVLGPNDRLQRICEALGPFISCTGHSDEWLNLSLQAEAKAAAVGDYLSAGDRALRAGEVYNRRGESKTVLECSSRALMYFRSGNAGSEKLASAIHKMGHGHENAENYSAAIEAFKEALALNAKSWPYKTDMIQDLCCLANVERDSEELQSAEQHLNEALERAREHDPHMVTQVLGDLASLAAHCCEWEKAENYCREALPKYESFHWQPGIAKVCHVLAKSLVKQERKEEALLHARRAVEIYTQLESLNLEDARTTLGECELE